jgi:hypothetical protein
MYYYYPEKISSVLTQHVCTRNLQMCLCMWESVLWSQATIAKRNAASKVVPIRDWVKHCVILKVWILVNDFSKEFCYIAFIKRQSQHFVETTETHIYTYTYMHTYTHTYILTYIHTSVPLYVCVCTLRATLETWRNNNKQAQDYGDRFPLFNMLS